MYRPLVPILFSFASLATFSALPGCGDSHSDAVDAPRGADAPAVSDTVPPAPYKRSFYTQSPPQFIMYRDGNGPWQVPAMDPDGSYTLHITYDYEIVARWANATGSDTRLYQYTIDDLVPIAFRPAPTVAANVPLPTGTVAVTGHMLQPGAVYLSGVPGAASETGPWSFAFDVYPSTYNLVAVGADRMVARRSLALTAPTTLSDIDLDTEGAATTITPVTLDHPPTTAESFLMNYEWLGVRLYTAPELVRPAPASLVQPGDLQLLNMLAQTSTTFRLDYYAPFTGAGTYVLPPPLGGVAFDRVQDTLSATCEIPPNSDGVVLLLASNISGFTRILTTEATPHWLTRHQATTVAFTASPPGFDPSWNVDVSGPYERELVVFTNGSVPEGRGILNSGVDEMVNGASARVLALDAAGRLPMRRAIGERSRPW
jgi:hypothetical protein